DALPAPFLQHAAVLADPVLVLERRGQVLGVDVLEADEHAPRAGCARLLDEALDLVAHRVDLERELDRQTLLPKLREPVEDRLPPGCWGSRSKIASQFRLRAKLSSVTKNRWMPCATFARTMRSTSSASRQREVRPWTLMIVQKLHLNGQPRPASKLVKSAM